MLTIPAINNFYSAACACNGDCAGISRSVFGGARHWRHWVHVYHWGRMRTSVKTIHFAQTRLPVVAKGQGFHKEGGSNVLTVAWRYLQLVHRQDFFSPLR